MLRDQRRRQRPAQGVFHLFLVLARPGQHADGWTLVRLLHVAVERFEIERQLAKMLRLELRDLQFKCDQILQAVMEEQQVEIKSCPPTCNRR